MRSWPQYLLLALLACRSPPASRSVVRADTTASSTPAPPAPPPLGVEILSPAPHALVPVDLDATPDARLRAQRLGDVALQLRYHGVYGGAGGALDETRWALRLVANEGYGDAASDFVFGPPLPPSGFFLRRARPRHTYHMQPPQRGVGRAAEGPRTLACAPPPFRPEPSRRDASSNVVKMASPPCVALFLPYPPPRRRACDMARTRSAARSSRTRAGPMRAYQRTSRSTSSHRPVLKS